MTTPWHKAQSVLFDYANYITYVLYLLTTLGISTRAPEYLDTMLYYIQLYVGIFLIMRFNPLRRIRVTDLDVKIAFNGGIILILANIMSFINKRFDKYIRDASFQARKIGKIVTPAGEAEEK